MESSESSPFDAFKSKKILHSESKLPSSSPSGQITSASSKPPANEWSFKTPEKPIDPPKTRARNRGTALSLKEVRQAAMKLRRSVPDAAPRPDPLLDSAKDYISSPSESPAPKLRKPSTNLPEKYEILDKFFSSLDSALRLLRLKGTAMTFSNISPRVECLTDRRFTHGHLAQLKFILPEAIEIRKTLVHDERTNCLKPDLHVTLDVSAIEVKGKLNSESGNLLLRKVFRSRLLDFFKSHPQVDDVPEEALPDPFNKTKQDVEKTDALSERRPLAASHLSQSFRKHFSQKVSGHEAENGQLAKTALYINSSVVPRSESDIEQSSSKKNLHASALESTSICSPKQASSRMSIDLSTALQLSPPPATPIKDTISMNNEGSSCAVAFSQGTPAQHTYTPAKLMSATPALQPPKRLHMSPDDDLPKSPSKLTRRPSRSRSLKFDTPVKNTKAEDEVRESGRLSSDDDIFDILPDNLLQSIREKERKALLEQDPAISQAKRRQKMIAGLPKLFDTIYFLFQSIKRSVITKEELMHKMIANHLEIIDRREVEEQLTLLQELVPEWLYEKTASSGDLLLCVNKISSPESIRMRLAEAK